MHNMPFCTKMFSVQKMLMNNTDIESKKCNSCTKYIIMVFCSLQKTSNVIDKQQPQSLECVCQCHRTSMWRVSYPQKNVISIKLTTCKKKYILQKKNTKIRASNCPRSYGSDPPLLFFPKRALSLFPKPHSRL